MKTSTMCLLSVPMLAAGALTLAGCGRSASTPTTVTYRQVGICRTYETPNGIEQAKTNEGFAIFKIESVDNTKYNDLFNFDPGRLYVNQSNAQQMAGNVYEHGSVYSWNRRFVNKDPRFGKAMGVKYVGDTTLAKGEKLDDPGFAVIPVGTNNPSGGPEADQYNYKLEYDTGTNDRGNVQSINEGMLIIKTNPPDAKYSVVDNCKELSLL
ncbi:MAG TPA: hypothetical protein VL996_00050 [Methylocella sp.]|nr:hypothetical protein [Methylocella sp.]